LRLLRQIETHYYQTLLVITNQIIKKRDAAQLD